jgi:hypothetical protein
MSTAATAGRAEPVPRCMDRGKRSRHSNGNEPRCLIVLDSAPLLGFAEPPKRASAVVRRKREFTKVVVLCDGLVIRLCEEAEFRPKPLVHVGGRPIIMDRVFWVGVYPRISESMTAHVVRTFKTFTATFIPAIARISRRLNYLEKWISCGGSTYPRQKFGQKFAATLFKRVNGILNGQVPSIWNRSISSIGRYALPDQRGSKL